MSRAQALLRVRTICDAEIGVQLEPPSYGTLASSLTAAKLSQNAREGAYNWLYERLEGSYWTKADLCRVFMAASEMINGRIRCTSPREHSPFPPNGLEPLTGMVGHALSPGSSG